MGLDLSKLDLSAMAASAGNSIGNLGLDVPDFGAYGKNFAAARLAQQQLQADYDKMAMQQAMQDKGISAEQAALAQRGQQALDLAQQQNIFAGGQNDLDRSQDMQKAQMQQAMEQQRLLQQGQYQQGQLGIAQQGQDLDRERLGMEVGFKQQDLAARQAEAKDNASFKMMQELSKMKAEERNRIGAFGATAAMIAKNNPKALPQVIEYGVSNGLFTPEQGQAFMQMDPNAIVAQGAMFAALTDHTNDYLKQIYPEEKQAASEGKVTIGPDGTITVDKMSSEKKVKADAQQSIVDDLKAVDQLEDIARTYKKDYLGYKGAAKGVAGDIISNMGLNSDTKDAIKSITGGAVNPAELERFQKGRSEFTSKVDNLKFQVIKSLSGLSYTDKQLEAMAAAIPSSNDSDATFEGKMKGYTNMIRATLKTKQEVAAEGVPTNSPEFQKSFSDRLQNNITQEIQSKNIPGVVIDGKWVSSEKLEAFSKATGKPLSEILKRKGVFQ